MRTHLDSLPRDSSGALINVALEEAGRVFKGRGVRPNAKKVEALLLYGLSNRDDKDHNEKNPAEMFFYCSLEARAAIVFTDYTHFRNPSYLFHTNKI